MTRGAQLALAMALAWGAAGARAQDAAAAPPPVSVRLEPMRGGDPFKYVFELRPAATTPHELVADRRLLELEVRMPAEGRRRARKLTCRHPDAPRRVDEDRVERLGRPGEPAVWREWVDLRMYCWGRALTALEDGAEVGVAYGFRGRGRGRWIARPESDASERERDLRATRRIEGAPITFRAIPDPPPRTARDMPVVVSLSPIDARSGSAVVFRPAVRANAGRVRVYVRNDLWKLRVRGPLGSVECALERTPINPIIDFFQTLRGRGAIRAALDASQLCPSGSFELAGIYEITPVLDLPYGGEELEIEAVTGTFEGRPVPLRVRRGERPYVVQAPEDATFGDGSDARSAR